MFFALKVTWLRFLMFVTRHVSKFIKMPSPYLFIGSDSSVKLCEIIAALGYKRLLIVTDSVLVELGLHQKVIATCSDNGVDTVVYKGVTPDPKMRQVEQGLALLKAERCDAVLAFGGGSSVDAAKVIAAAATNEKPLDKMVGMMKVPNPVLPLFAIPTTAGTGSETTPAAVISDDVTGEKKLFGDPKLVPRMAALDALLMVGMPKSVTAATGLDALTHALESYLSTHATAETEVLCKAAIRLIFKHLSTAFEQNENLKAREAMALASFYAGAAFTQTNVGYVHAIAHRFGEKFHTPHGLANAIALVPVLRFYHGEGCQRLSQLARELGLGASGDSAHRLGSLLIEAIEKLIKELGIPDKNDAMGPKDVTVIASEALAEAHGLYPVPHYMTQHACERVLRTMLVV